MAQLDSTKFSGKRGIEVLRDPEINKAAAFTESERDALGLTGLLPAGFDAEAVQLQRVMLQLETINTDLERYGYLINLLETSEKLFYKVVISDLPRFLPILYTPTVGEACQKFSHIFQRPRGMFLSLAHKGRVKEVLRNWPKKDVRMICVTSGGRILGLGDLGANGMGIPIGKLMLYTACAAVPPQYLLPVHIDCGTTNQALINDPLYLGLRIQRVPFAEMDEFVDEFVTAVQEVFPGCCIHFEDWAGVDAMRLLEHYRDRVSCFNDDMQCTAAVVLAGLFSALRVTGGKLIDQRIVFHGAGSAAVGIADLIASAMTLEGLSEDQARSRIFLVNSKGLIESTRTGLNDFHLPYAHPHAPLRDLPAIVEALKPTAIIGVSTQGKAFTQQVIESMARFNKRPIIFALSNPTSRAECTAEEAYRWSNGSALFAAGVAFPPVQFGNTTFIPGQGNNMFIFPALGLAVSLTRAKRVTDEMFFAVARGLAEQVTQGQLESGLLYPPQTNILETEINNAVCVCEVIFECGLAQVEKPSDIRSWIIEQLYTPDY